MNALAPEPKFITLHCNPYPITIDALFLDYPDYAPRNFWKRKPNNLLVEWAKRYICADMKSYKVFIHPDIAKLTRKGKRIWSLMNEKGLLPKKPNYQVVPPIYEGRLNLWSDEYRERKNNPPSKRLTLENAKNDAVVFYDFLNGVKKKQDRNSFYRQAKKEISEDGIDASLSKRSHTKKQQFKRFSCALAVAHERVYPNIHVFEDGCPKVEVPHGTDPQRFAHEISAEVLFAAHRNLFYWSSAKYRKHYKQRPPENAFDELINAHWRKWVHFYANLPDKSR